MPYDKILAGFVVVLFIGLALAAAITLEKQSDEAAISNVTFEIVKADSGEEIGTFTMAIPREISLFNKMQSYLNMGPLTTEETVSVTTDIDEGTEIEIRCNVDVWWQAQDIESIDKVDLTQSASDYLGYTLENPNGNSEIGATETSDIPVDTSESDAYRIAPDSQFDRNQQTTYIEIEEMDGSEWTNSVEVTATGQDGSTVTSSTTVITTLNIDYNEIDATLDVSASVDSIWAGTSASA